MRNQHRLGAEQYKFLVGFRDKPQTLGALMKEVEIDVKRVSRWFRRSHFREAASGVSVEVMRMDRIEFKLLVRLATITLSKMLSGEEEPTLVKIQLCLGILEAYRRRHPRARGRRANREEAFDALKLIHPNVSMERAAEIFAEMRREEGKQTLETNTPPAEAGGPVCEPMGELPVRPL